MPFPPRPPNPLYLGTAFFGGGCRHCMSIRTQVLYHFFFYMGPLTNDGVQGAISKFPRSASSEALEGP